MTCMITIHVMIITDSLKSEIQFNIGTAQHNTPRYLHKDHDHLRASPLLSEFCELLVVLVPREECLAYESHSVDSPCAPVQESPLQSSSNEKQDVTVVRCSKPTLQKDHDG